MRDLRSYWQEVHATAAALPESVSIVSANGSMTEVPAEVAAKLFVAKSHRLATEEEIRAAAQAAAIRKRDTARERLRKRGIEVVAVARRM